MSLFSGAGSPGVSDCGTDSSGAGSSGVGEDPGAGSVAVGVGSAVWSGEGVSSATAAGTAPIESAATSAAATVMDPVRRMRASRRAR
jgi:hypothetical protein